MTTRAPQMLTVPEVAKRLAMSIPFVRKAIKERTLAIHHIGRSVRVSEENLAAYMQRFQPKPRAKRKANQ